MIQISKLLAIAPFLTGAVLAGCSSGTNSSPIASSPTKGLLTVSDAASLGYPTVQIQPHEATQTDVPGCTKAASAVYADQPGKTTLTTGVVVCNTTADANRALFPIKQSSTTSPQLPPPSDLGKTAFETSNTAPKYPIYWQDNSLIFFTVFTTDASANPSAVPITPDQQRTLELAADRQQATIEANS